MTRKKEGFAHRWARLAHQVRRAQASEPNDRPATEPAAPACEDEGPDLPPIESLDADSDYTAFLAANVPKALKTAALRKAWTSNPAIMAHEPLVEYAWDCNAPGYGKLRPDDLTGKLARNLLRHFLPEEEREGEHATRVEVAHASAAGPAPALAKGVAEPVPAASAEQKHQDAVPGPAQPLRDSQDRMADDDDDEPRRKRHGSARPG